MTAQEVITEIPSFSFEERLAILQSIAQSLSDAPPPKPKRGGSAERLRGLLKPDDGKIPNDEEVKEIIADYLMEKYS